uniref:Uncharacterized protein n=1 Tax=Salix viminalis TaxID=40686 RepID=A0A6N2NGV7_SALVM
MIPRPTASRSVFLLNDTSTRRFKENTRCLFWINSTTSERPFFTRRKGLKAKCVCGRERKESRDAVDLAWLSYRNKNGCGSWS